MQVTLTYRKIQMKTEGSFYNYIRLVHNTYWELMSTIAIQEQLAETTKKDFMSFYNLVTEK